MPETKPGKTFKHTEWWYQVECCGHVITTFPGGRSLKIAKENRDEHIKEPPRAGLKFHSPQIVKVVERKTTVRTETEVDA